jgi:hypothetical protein
MSFRRDAILSKETCETVGVIMLIERAQYIAPYTRFDVFALGEKRSGVSLFSEIGYTCAVLAVLEKKHV